MKNIGIFGSCQIFNSKFFLNNNLLTNTDLNIKFCLQFYQYDEKIMCGYRGILDYNIFNDLDILIIENNNLENQASSEKIINYCKNKNSKIKIIKTCLLKFPIYPINWSGYGENKNDYLNWTGLENINYVDKFNKILNNMEKEIINTDLNNSIVEFIRNNFNKVLLFTHSLHPTNILLYELWRLILKNLDIDIQKYKYIFTNELILCWFNPFTSKMVNDLNINFDCLINECKINDEFYISRYKENINNILLKN
jgi:hypothetical protein